MLSRESVRVEFVEWLRRGVPAGVAARRVGVGERTGLEWARAAGLARPVGRPRKDRQVRTESFGPPGSRLGVQEREEIAINLAQGCSIRGIARIVGRPPSTVSREIRRNQGVDGHYRAYPAQQATQDRAKRPKPSKLAKPGRLHDTVSELLMGRLSPEQVSERLILMFPDDPTMRVCHETIYQALYVQARGGLKREVEATLRTGRVQRKPHRVEGERRGRNPGMISISERPPDVEDRAVPGHWEGDLILGSVVSHSAVVTLVERTTRLVLLASLPDHHGAVEVRDVLIPLIQGLPTMLTCSLTWDQGHEMALHRQISIDTGIAIYFADPHSPWQRGSNENTNGLLRQYLPKGTDLSVHTDLELAEIAAELNNRPRKTLGWLTPIEVFLLLQGIPVTIGGQPAHLPDSLKPLTRCNDT